MKLDELARKIRDVIRSDTLAWDDIKNNRTSSQCKEITCKIYDLLNKPGHRIHGLSVAVVTNYLDLVDHAWLIAHHPSTGFFMIDPTIGQFVNNAGGQSCNDVFIDTYHELKNKLVSGEYKFRDGSSAHLMHIIWSPALRFLDKLPYSKSTAPRIYYKPHDVDKVWSKYEFPVSTHTIKDMCETSSIERHGIGAARMQEVGVNWQRAIQSYYGRTWPASDNPEELAFFDGIIEARNRHIRLGSHKERLGQEYNKGKPRHP